MGARRDILGRLAELGPTRSAALRAALGGVSRPTLSRLVAAVREDVFVFGNGPATRHARRRSIDGLGRTVPAYRIEESGHPARAGQLHFLWGTKLAWEDETGAVRVHEGLPPALVDMAPQGYLGRGLPQRFPELRLPPRVTDWTDDHRLLALSLRGEDCVGNLVVGDESLRRFLTLPAREISTSEYPAKARASESEPLGSSAGGERPKFGAFTDGRHVLVKFQQADGTGPGRRWCDLLWCEWKALETLAAAGHAAAAARCIDVDGWRFLEVERFDRVGPRGRVGVVSLAALNNEYLGGPNGWTDAALALQAPPLRLPAGDAKELRWRDVFGQLTANSDRHLGNVEFFQARDGSLHIAPVYDMLPMTLAPGGGAVVPREFVPEPPDARTFDVWEDAARWALLYWKAVLSNPELEKEVREFAAKARRAVAGLSARVVVGG